MTERKTALHEALKQHVTTLSAEIGPRTMLDPDSLAQAERYIRGAFEDAGFDVCEQRYTHRRCSVANLIATPPGSGTARAYYVVGAHYDTVPGSPGADDNASSVAVLLELARRLAKRGAPAPVRLVAFTLEEPPNFMTGHQGSRVFVREVEQSGERVLGAVVLEMVGYTTPKQNYPLVLRWAGYPDQGNFIGIVGNWTSRGFGKTVLKGFRRNPGLPVESLFIPWNGWILPSTRLSDHASFWDRGLPAVMVTDTAFFRNPFYHSPLDVPETLDLSFMAELVTSLELALAELAG
jgi:Zn-dependent M28 family amino/carboxypeptidase